MSKSSIHVALVCTVFILIGLIDSAYLTYKYYYGGIPPCSVGIFADCGTVLKSKYAVLLGVPLAFWGIIHYITLLFFLVKTYRACGVFFSRGLFVLTTWALLFSLYLVWIQGYVIGAWCQYCLISAMMCIFLFFTVRIGFYWHYQEYFGWVFGHCYRFFIKPILFSLDPEFIHDHAMVLAQWIGKNTLTLKVISFFFKNQYRELDQNLMGVQFSSPIGLAAGYDYRAQCMSTLPVFGFGYQTIGTITHLPCVGNEKPRLGRLPKSRSLLVNKGFRNPGSFAISQKLIGRTFAFPVGISIGITNDRNVHTVKDGVADIIACFKEFEKPELKHAYYELNISCPNLGVPFSFYEKNNLLTLLKAVEKLNLHRPMLVKMPIDRTNDEFAQLLLIMKQFPVVKGLIIGNLQKDRSDLSFDKNEIEIAGKGHFSGKPTYVRSNELISLAYSITGKRFIIIGCGGVFGASDAYEKIKRGATLIQMITGMIFEGPQIVSQINKGIVKLLKKDGYSHISQAVGVNSVNR